MEVQVTMEVQVIQNKIYEIRGRRVMLDFDLAELYGVPTKALKQSVRRNIERFEGDDFMFEVTEIEYNRLNISLRSQIVTSNQRGGRRYLPFAFTEIDNLYNAFVALSTRTPKLEKNRTPIGYRTNNNQQHDNKE